jgi:mercuric ion transport protein
MALKSHPWFKTGLWGSIIAAICCATPVLPFILGLIGLAAVAGYLDYVLLPLLAAFLILALYRWLKKAEKELLKSAAITQFTCTAT